ncbi:hypothetical protein [Lacinutrix jangbogonensis]|uniref:hypothetical protein n=1 Tax=Lacinutrix jangbogonensis TaxID=1469557 RepID=UPI00053D67E4|nr:hypothetical protein [Lacinutrix jangbogonensis]
MKKKFLTSTILRGIALAFPLSVVVYILSKFIKVFEKLIGPIAKKFEVEHVFGEITLTFFAILIMLTIIFLLGLLMKIKIIANLKGEVELLILKFIPSLNHLKLMAAEKLNSDHAVSNWKAVLVIKDDQCFPAYIIEENEVWITLAKVGTANTNPAAMMIIKQSSVTCISITMKQMRVCNKQFGKGYTEMIK